MLLINGFDFKFSFQLAFWYILANLKLIHPLIPQKLKARLP